MPDPVPYQEMTADTYGEDFAKSATPTPTRRGVLLSGTCPRCGDPMQFPVVTEIFQSVGSDAARSAPPATEETPVLCTCVATHSDRPAGEEGCGAYWNIRLTRPAL